MYDQYSAARMGNTGEAAAGEGEMTLDQLATAIAQYSEVYNYVRSVPEDSLAFLSEEERMIADGLPDVVDYYLEAGGTLDELRKYPEFVKYEASKTAN